MKKRILSLLLALALACSLLVLPVNAAEIVDSGTCGDSLMWSLDTDGVLTISGSGEMYHYDYRVRAPWYTHRNEILNVVISDGVTSIGNGAFENCKMFTNVSIPGSVTSLGGWSFERCSGLTSVTMNNVETIGDYAFYQCNSLTNVIFSERVTNIGSYAFEDCVSLENVIIPDSVTSIGAWAFKNCAELSSIEIPADVTSIGKGAFTECNNLAIIIVDPNNMVYSAKDGALLSDGGTALECCPAGKTGAYQVPNTVRSIAAYGFYGCDKLTSVIIPNSVKSIGDRAFLNCSSLTDVYFGGSEEEWNSISTGDYGNYDNPLANAAIHYCFSALSITSQPQDYVGALNSTATFTVAAEGENLSYQWQLSSDGENWSNSSVKTAKYSTKLTQAKDGRMVRCVITDPSGASVTSDVATMWISKLAITQQPQNYVGKVNSTASFTVAAEGEGLTYQWQTSADGSKWSNSSVKAAKYSTKLTAAKDGRMVRCIVTDQYGVSVTSDAATMTVAKLAITTQPKNYTGALNSTASFSVAAEGEGLTYQWQISDDGMKWSNSSVKKAVYTTKLTEAKDGRMVRCIVKDAYGNTVTTDAVTMKLAGPVITTQPKNYVGAVNSTAKFTVAAEGDGLTYQWQTSANGTSWSNSSVKNASYSTKLTSAKDGRYVRCIVTDSDGNSTISDAVTMKIG